ncbi:DUF559 domain-containing protein [Deinococcus soli (ex Cha et al. 2016)]|uniref:G:T-mismatch repair DNA endonuclease (Very short patch repair protein) n=1 Tax=Deinococcus soli (ex Cha et al. 2016) TaxID=1309411 RepID=A0ACC6KNM5_9DEIO|nr:DUF559 domain-containing protein [Deinococcus soli (ex Cha et al. 2016)]MDR6330650.1 G:T-mismatch repair DNA endonuclease (very short patch repair protein) [Deinococcus soli (ex Cha et al. 2016)]MDR6754017.1 G:T-mismatch repair DNA endonuclease (very short patch repair protein) [Deinococcus soli (ex Cha et al. 2016)]
MQTEPERIGYGILKRLGLPYRAQHLVARKFCVDAYLPEQKVVVQFDGDYWHGHPAKYAALDARQARRVNHDRSQDAYMAKLGYRVIRIWESDLKKRPEAVQEGLRKALTDGSSYVLQ